MIDFTLVTAVDKHHITELLKVWPTWVQHKKEMRNCPVHIIYDTGSLSMRDMLLLDFLREDNRNITLLPWVVPDNLYSSQREKMLTALTVLPPKYVKTRWFLKLDTDTFAVDNSKWIEDYWFNTHNSVFIANGWGYTKPANAIECLDDWGDTIREIKKYPRLDIPYDPSWSRICHKRISSWVFFCKTDWAEKMAKYIKRDDGYYKLPVPSQDTYLWYVAKRMGYSYTTVKFKKMGWKHSPKVVKNMHNTFAERIAK